MKYISSVLPPPLITFLSVNVSNTAALGAFDSESGAIVRGRAHTFT